MRPYALYAAFGYAHLPCAVEKVRLSDHTRLRDHCALLCHDVPLVNGKLPDGVFAACNQDVYAEGRQAMEIAHHYPDLQSFPGAETDLYSIDDPGTCRAAACLRSITENGTRSESHRVPFSGWAKGVIRAWQGGYTPALDERRCMPDG